MSCNWPLKRISQVANFENNKRIPLKSLDREKRQGQFPYYGASGIVDYIDDFIFDGCYLLISEDGENLRTRNTPIAFQANGKFWVNNHAHILSEKEEGILDYLEYYFSMANIGAYITGAVQPKLNKANLDKIEIPIPPLNERVKLNQILNSLKNKVSINVQTNQTLEEMAQAIFKSWFVDFDPVKAKMNGEQPEGMDAATASLFPEKLVESELGLIPDGWEIGELSKLFELHRGFDLPKSKRQEGEYPVYAAGGFHGTHSEYKMEPPGIITGRSGVIGNVYLSLDKYWPLNTTLYVREFRKCGPYYAYHLLRSLDLKSLNSGSAVPSLNRNFVHSTSVCHPDSEVLVKFEEIVTPLFEKMVANNEENKSLSELRDTLLPKLLSGEIKLSGTIGEFGGLN